MKVKNTEIKANFKYEKNEYVKSRRKFLLENKTISIGNIIFLIVMTLIEIVFILIHEFFFAIIIGTLLLISYILVYILCFVQPRKIYEKADFLKKEMNIKINNEAIKIKRGESNYTIYFLQIPEIWETEEFIYVFQDKKNYFLIPKRALKNNSDSYNLQKMYCEANNNRKI